MTYREALKARIAAATKGLFMGRSEAINGAVWWALYQGRSGIDGFKGRDPIAYFRSHVDAAAFLRTDVELLLAQLERAEAALEDLLGSGLDVNGGRNLGKSWSEYQVEDGAVKDAHLALASLRAVLDAEEK